MTVTVPTAEEHAAALAELGRLRADVDKAWFELAALHQLKPVRNETELRRAIDARGEYGGAILLPADEITVDAPVMLPRGVRLVSLHGPMASKLKAGQAMPRLVGIEQYAGGSGVVGIHLDADELAAVGLEVNPGKHDPKQPGMSYGGDVDPDPVFRAENLFISDATSAGVYLGQHARSTDLFRIRVRRAWGWGFYLRNPDSWICNSEATTAQLEPGQAVATPDGQVESVGTGFFVGTVNTTFTNNKAWYCRGYGWDVKASRNTFAASESQDTKSHGWRIRWDKNTFNGCRADTAGFKDVGGVGGVDGFYVDGAGDQSFTGCNAFNRFSSLTARTQRYGYSLPKELIDRGLFVGNTGYWNTAGLVNARA